MQKGRVDIITMGCSKNLVDSERLMARIRAKGYEVYHDSQDVCGELVVVNTCGFIGDAKRESIDMILQLSQGRSSSRIGSLVVMGCLSERYLKELQDEIPEVDAWYGKFDWEHIIDTLPDISIDAKTTPMVKPWDRVLSGAPYSAYIKVSEGCNRFCAYCAIPLITGRHHSRPIAEILQEVKDLVAKGVTEFNVIAQDLSAYGTDIGYTNTPAPGEQSGLATLVEAMANIPGVHWIRLHYAYPVDFPWDITDVMRRYPNVCNYLDIALQHISTPVLANMRRHIDKEQTISLIDRLRAEVPGIRIRTTLMTGFPGEDEQAFDELVEFVSTTRFDRMGAFSYCEEDDTWAQKHLDDNIPQQTKDARREKILEIQEDISATLNQRLIGTTIEVLVESVYEDEMTGRTQWDSPEVDCEVHISVDNSHAAVQPGQYVQVKVIDADAFDIYAALI